MFQAQYLFLNPEGFSDGKIKQNKKELDKTDRKNSMEQVFYFGFTITIL